MKLYMILPCTADGAAALTVGAAVLAAARPALADEAAVEEAAAITDAMELAVQSAEEAIKAAEQALESGRVDATVVTAVHEAADAVDAAFAAEQAGVGADVIEAGTEVAADLGAAASAMKQAASAAVQSTTDASIVDAIQAAAAAIQAAAASAQDVAGQVQGLVSPAVPVAKEVRRAGWEEAARHVLGHGHHVVLHCLAGRLHLLALTWERPMASALRTPLTNMPPPCHRRRPSWPPPPPPTWPRARWLLWRSCTWRRRWPRARRTASAATQVGPQASWALAPVHGGASCTAVQSPASCKLLYAVQG